MKKTIIIIGIIVLSGCASSSKTYAPDGREAFSLNCSGTARNWGMCYKKAGEICKEQGYDTVVVNGEKGVSVSAYENRRSAGLYGSSLHFRTMTIACKNDS